MRCGNTALTERKVCLCIPERSCDSLKRGQGSLLCFGVGLLAAYNSMNVRSRLLELELEARVEAKDQYIGAPKAAECRSCRRIFKKEGGEIKVANWSGG